MGLIQIHRIMDQMDRARGRHRQWRQSMSSSQRQAYLARRRSQARGKRPMVETSHDYHSEAGPSNRNEQGSGIRILLNFCSSIVWSKYVVFFNSNAMLRVNIDNHMHYNYTS